MVPGMEEWMKERLEEVRGEILKEYPNCRERSLALTKLDECELWLGRAANARQEFVNE